MVPYSPRRPSGLSRRAALKLLAGLAAALAACSTTRSSPRPAALRAAATVPDPAAFGLDAAAAAALTAALAPYPGRQALLQQALSIDSAQQAGVAGLAEALAASVQGAPPLPPANRRLASLRSWQIGDGPNYSHGATIDGRAQVWAACFVSGVVSATDVAADRVTHYKTGPATNPLDVTYDAARRRVVVASADNKAKMVVFDAAYSIIATLDLVSLLDQGESRGGAQGVTVDAAGDYWFALAYYSQWGKGVLVKLDGETLEPRLIVRDIGINNPNGIVTNPAGDRIFAFADNGFGYELDLDGNVLREHPTVFLGYRGTVVDDELWVCGWLPAGRMARIDLVSGARREFPCIPLANSVQVDATGHVWVAGDAGVSVSNRQGELLAVGAFGAFTNGLSVLGDQAFLVSYDSRLHHATDDLIFMPLAGGPPAR
jgi:DNA-binding beta-propeller fold protein YncE